MEGAWRSSHRSFPPLKQTTLDPFLLSKGPRWIGLGFRRAHYRSFLVLEGPTTDHSRVETIELSCQWRDRDGSVLVLEGSTMDRSEVETIELSCCWRGPGGGRHRLFLFWRKHCRSPSVSEQPQSTVCFLGKKATMYHFGGEHSRPFLFATIPRRPHA